MVYSISGEKIDFEKLESALAPENTDFEVIGITDGMWLRGINDGV